MYCAVPLTAVLEWSSVKHRVCVAVCACENISIYTVHIPPSVLECQADLIGRPAALCLGLGMGGGGIFFFLLL